MTLPARASESWVSGLPPCTASQARTKLAAGGSPVFVLTPSSTPLLPEWWFVVKSKDGTLFRVVSGRSLLCRRIDSLKVAYRTARLAGLEIFALPIDVKGKP
jgi:hypothetical protein